MSLALVYVLIDWGKVKRRGPKKDSPNDSFFFFLVRESDLFPSKILQTDIKDDVSLHAE